MNLPFFKAGQTPDSVVVNSIFSDLNTETGNLDTDAIRTGGVGRQHFVEMPTVSTSSSNAQQSALHKFAITNGYNSAITGTYSSTSYTYVNHGADPCGFAWNTTLANNQILRLHAGCFIPDHEYSLGIGEYRFRFYWDIGAGYVPIDNMYYPYSMSCRTAGVGLETQFKRQRVGFSMAYLNTTGSKTIAGIQLRVAIMDAGNTVDIQHYHIFGLICKA